MKRKLQFLVTAGLLLVTTVACQRENDLDTQAVSETEINKKVNLEEAKKLFELSEKKKVERKIHNKNGYFLTLTPNWDSFEQNTIITGDNFSAVETSIFNSKKVKGNILFLKERDSTYQHLLMTRIDSVNPHNKDILINASFFFFETDGSFLYAYKMENGIITKKARRIKQKGLTARGNGCRTILAEHIFEYDDYGWEIGCSNDNGERPGPAGPNPFTFDGVNELYEVVVIGKRPKRSWEKYKSGHLSDYPNYHYSNTGGRSNSKVSTGARLMRDHIKEADKEFGVMEEQIIDQITDEKIKCLHDKLRNGNNDYVKEIFSKFEGNGTEFDIVISSENKVLYEGREVNAKTTFTRGSKVIHIRISESKAVGRSALDIAKTIFHEYIHADIHRKLKTINYENTPEIKSFRETYSNYIEMLAKKNNIKEVPDERRHHEYMAKYYVSVMRDALKKFHKEQLTADYNKYVEHYEKEPSDELYEALAWQGLNAAGIKAYEEEDADKKKRMNHLLETEVGMLTKNCE